MKSIITDITSRDAFLKGKEALEVGYPWLTFGAIIALEHLVNKYFKVLEFGIGGSTVFFASRCASVKSFETDAKWFGRVNERAKGFTNIEITLATETEILETVKREPDNYYDLILIDSQPRHSKRLLLANAATPKIKQGGWLVLDNYMRFGMKDFNYSGWQVYTFDEFGYTGQGTRLCKKI